MPKDTSTYVDATSESRNLPTFNKYGSRYVYNVMQSPQPAHPVGCTLFRNHKQSNGYDDPKMGEIGERKFGLMFRGSRLSNCGFVMSQKT